MLVVVVIVCLLQKSTFSQTQPSSESFGKIALDVFFMPESEAAPAPKNTPDYSTQQSNADDQRLIAHNSEKSFESPARLLD